MDIQDTYTIQQLIDTGSNNTDSVSYYNLSLIQKAGNIEYSIKNLLDDYIDELQAISVNVEMTPVEFARYQYKPKLLAQELYGDAELYFVILALNNKCDVKEFNIKKLNLIRRENIADILNYIYNAEKDFIAKNRENNS